ncbi:hypothetical protein WCD93_31140, partial [Klebsiella michiganensis]
EVVVERVYYSVGGGFVVDDEAAGADRVVEDTTRLPLPFSSGKELLAHCEREGISIPELMRRNEEAFRPWEQTRAALLNIWQVMQDCVEAGCESTGTSPEGSRSPGVQPCSRSSSSSAHLATAVPPRTAVPPMPWEPWSGS